MVSYEVWDHLIFSLLHRVDMVSIKGFVTRMYTSEKLSLTIEDRLGPEEATMYRSSVSALQYMVLTGHDIIYSVARYVCTCNLMPTYIERY
jgi:hypothetical protein